MNYEDFKLLHINKSSSKIFTFNFNSIFNFTKHTFSVSEKNLLNKGLKFIPIPKITSNSEILNAWTRTHRSILWRIYNTNRSDDNGFNIKLWRFAKKDQLPNCPLPLTHSVHDILTQIDSIIRLYCKSTSKFTKSSSSDRRLIRNTLDKYQDVIFIPADKNLGLVALHLDDYDSLVKSHLNNPNIYTTVELNLNDLMNKYQQIVSLIKTNMNPSNMEFKTLKNLKVNSFRLPKFHIMPKLHKKLNNIDPSQLPSRPIVGAPCWFTTPISIFLDSTLQPLIKKLDHILKNSQSLIDKIKSIQLNPNINNILVSFDVESLYTNIDLKTFPFIFDQLYIEFDIDTKSIIHLINFIVHNNYIEYNNEIYQQINGIAMGTNAAVSLANLYLYVLVDKFLLKQPNIISFNRYIDDIFFIYTDSLSNLNNLFSIANNLHPSIKFTLVHSTSNIEFLDLNIILKHNSTIEYEVHQKSLNKYMYITQQSCHPNHTFTGFIRGELQRYCRLSSSPHYFKKIKTLFFYRLLSRGYNIFFLEKIFAKFCWSNYIPNIKEKVKTTVLPFIIRYSTRKHLKRLQKLLSPFKHSLAKYIPNSEFLCVYSKSRPLGSYITSSSLKPIQKELLKRKSTIFNNIHKKRKFNPNRLNGVPQNEKNYLP